MEAQNLENLILALIHNGALKTPRIIEAFRGVDRADFVRTEDTSEAYEDYPLSIGHGQTISQPTTVALMLELLAPEAGDRVLDVGSGSGWTTAFLASIVGSKGRVFGLERIGQLVEFGRSNLGKYDFPWASIALARDELGLSSEAPFGRILVSAAADTLPQELVDQLKVGGRMVLPVQNSVWKIDKVSKAKLAKEEHPGFVFVPLRKA